MIVNREMDTKLYSKLVGRVAPTVIAAEKEYERLMKEFDKL